MKIIGKKDVQGAIAKAEAFIDAAAENERLLHTASGAVMQAVYQHKIEEAASFSSGLGIGTYPLLEAEAKERNISLAQMAAMVLEASAAWKEKMAEIERRRINAKVSIRGLNCVATIQKISQSAFPSSNSTGT